jgi:cytochrome c peroxidase
LRNAALQPAFFHNGAFTRIEDAIRHHLNVYDSNQNYNPVTAGVDADLTHRVGPAQPVLARVDPLLKTPKVLSTQEFNDLVAFVRDGLLDPNARKQNLCTLSPAAVPSGFTVMQFEACPAPGTRSH